MDPHRRLLIAALAAWPAARAGAQRAQAPSANEPPTGALPRHKIGAATLYDALSQRMPMRFGMPGLLELQVTAPRLHLLPARNKVGATLQAQPIGPSVPRTAGEIDLAFGLRWERADRTLRATDAQVLDLRLPGMAPGAMQALAAVLEGGAREVLEGAVLHRFSERELALPESMGFEPGTITVVDDGIVVAFTPLRAR